MNVFSLTFCFNGAGCDGVSVAAGCAGPSLPRVGAGLKASQLRVLRLVVARVSKGRNVEPARHRHGDRQRLWCNARKCGLSHFDVRPNLFSRTRRHNLETTEYDSVS